jgi:Protein of unknown function (DUF998)
VEIQGLPISICSPWPTHPVCTAVLFDAPVATRENEIRQEPALRSVPARRWRASLLRRALAVASIAASAACASTVVAHTLLRADLNAVRDSISAYAHGAYGYLQVGVFLAIGLASIALALALWLLPSPGSRHGWSHVMACISIGFWGLAMLACSVVDTDALILSTLGNLHDLIVKSGFVLLVAGILLVACARSRCRIKHALQHISRPWAAASIAVLTLAAVAQHEAWFGLAERLLALCVVSWLIAVGLHVFRGPRYAELTSHSELGKVIR